MAWADCKLQICQACLQRPKLPKLQLGCLLCILVLQEQNAVQAYLLYMLHCWQDIKLVLIGAVHHEHSLRWCLHLLGHNYRSGSACSDFA